MVSADSDYEGDGFVTVERAAPSELMLHTDGSIWRAADSLADIAERHPSKATLEEESRTYGLHWNANGVLWDKSLRAQVRPAFCCVYGWCLVFVVSGIANVELWIFLERAKELNLFSFSDVHDFFQEFIWPSCTRNAPKSCFNATRAKSCWEARED